MKFKISFLTQWVTPFGLKGVSVRVYVENSISPLNCQYVPFAKYLGSKSISIRDLRLISDTYEV